MLEKAPEYRQIAKNLIKTLPELKYIKDSDVRIAYLRSDVEKKKNRKVVFGECHKVASNYEWCCEFDFFIIIYDMNILYFNEEQLETLIRHELHHVGIDNEGNETRFYVVPHDVEEFWEIVNDKGLDWAKEGEYA